VQRWTREEGAWGTWDGMRQRLRFTLRIFGQLLFTALALLTLILVVLLTLVGFPVAILAVTFLALAAASMLWTQAATDWLAAVQTFGWTLLAVTSLSGGVIFVRRVFVRRGKATLRGAR
jgi:hypothetical protein